MTAHDQAVAEIRRLLVPRPVRASTRATGEACRFAADYGCRLSCVTPCQEVEAIHRARVLEQVRASV